MKTNPEKDSARANDPLQLQESDAPGKSMTPPPFSLDASAQLKPEGEGEEGLQAAAPIQRQSHENGGAAIQRRGVNELTPEQQHLRAEFLVYQRTKAATLSGPERGQFDAACTAFVARMDDSPFLSNTPRWGGRAYRSELGNSFSDYTPVLSGETTRLNDIALSQAQAAQASATATVQKAQSAVQLATSNLEAARVAAAEAETAAVAAETAATQAEAAAQGEGAVEYNRQAAVQARAAATAARTAADEAAAAVRQAEGSLEFATDQHRFSQGQLEMATAQIQEATTNTDVIRAEQLVTRTATLNTAVGSLNGAIDTTTTASNTALEGAQEANATAQSQSETARAEGYAATPIPELQGHIDDVTAASDSEREARAIELMEFARAQMALYPTRIATLRAQPTPDPAEKVRIIGEIAAAAARVEWLIGTIYLEGSESSDKWEDNGSNNDAGGVLSSYYQDQTSASSGPWCTKFVGTVYKSIADLRDENGNSPNGRLWSGYKLSRNDYFNTDNDQGGDHTGVGHQQNDQDAISDLRAALVATNVAEERVALVETFFEEHFGPQPGDVMVKRRPGAPANDFNDDSESHTTLIERVVGHQLYTIEGNSGNRLAGKTYNMDDPGDVEEIVFFSRFSMNAFGPTPDTDGPAAEQAPNNGPTTTEAELLAPITQLSERLQAYAQAQGYANEVAEGAADAVYNMQESTSGDAVE